MSATDTGGQVAGIPLRNIWLLLLYASKWYQEEDPKHVAIAEDAERIPDLIAEVLCRRVEQRLRRRLTHAYERRAEELSRVRGRIDLRRTLGHQTLARGKVACRYDQLSLDTPRNRYVRSALERLAPLVSTETDLPMRCRRAAGTMRQMGVVGACPAHNTMKATQFGRNDRDDQQMLAAARLAFELALLTEAAGIRRLVSPSRNIHWLRRVFEKGIAGFYEVHLARQNWRVQAGTQIQWQVTDPSAGFAAILPGMQTDIMLDPPGEGARIIIDTKFTSVLARGHYHSPTSKVRSAYIYQMYAYLRAQAGIDPRNNKAQGMLLHPAIGENIDEFATIQDHFMRFVTVDLSQSAAGIRKQLLDLVGAGGG